MRMPDLKSAHRKRLETRRQRDRDFRNVAAEATELKKCEALDEDNCRALVCPKHRKRLAYCPWAKNGHVNTDREIARAMDAIERGDFEEVILD